MSTTRPTLEDWKVEKNDVLDQLMPRFPATEVPRDKRVRIEFDRHIAMMVKEHANQRALSQSKYPDRDSRNHLTGFVGEVGVAVYWGGTVDTRVLDDYEGDSGYDVTIPSLWGQGRDRVQVKTTQDLYDPERPIDRDNLSNFDVAVLCCTDVPESYVEIVGYVPSRTLKLMCDGYGRSGPVLREEVLHPITGESIPPADVREVLQNQIE